MSGQARMTLAFAQELPQVSLPHGSHLRKESVRVKAKCTAISGGLSSSVTVQGSYVTGGALTHPSHWSRFSYVVGALTVVGGGLWLFSAFRDANKRRRYQRAYAEVQKYD